MSGKTAVFCFPANKIDSTERRIQIEHTISWKYNTRIYGKNTSWQCISFYSGKRQNRRNRHKRYGQVNSFKNNFRHWRASKRDGHKGKRNNSALSQPAPSIWKGRDCITVCSRKQHKKGARMGYWNWSQGTFDTFWTERLQPKALWAFRRTEKARIPYICTGISSRYTCAWRAYKPPWQRDGRLPWGLP